MHLEQLLLINHSRKAWVRIKRNQKKGNYSTTRSFSDIGRVWIKPQLLVESPT